ncbi:MAG: hypothetical protein ACSLFQ_14420 [Thermoanaerobaculia bacterium]
MQVGGLTIGVESASTSLRLCVSDVCTPFLAARAVPDLNLTAHWGALDREPNGELIFDSGATWRLYARGDRYVYQFFDANFGEAPYKEARINLDFTHGEIVLDPEAFVPGDPVDALEFPVDELLCIRMLAARGGIELHACGVVAPSGDGYIFAGQSGDGKTTTARLWETLPGASVLSDDRIIVRRDDDGTWWMYGTPWHGEGELAVNARAPLRAMMLLERGSTNALIRIDTMAAISGLLARSFVPFYDETLMASTVEFLGALTSEVPCFRMPFVPASEAVQFVLESAS